MRNNIILSIILMTWVPLYPTAALESATPSSDSQVTVQFDNGTPPQPEHQSKALTTFGDSFSIEPGDTFSVGVGTSQFSLKNFPSSVDQIQLAIELNPGDRRVNLTLPGGNHITTNRPETIRVWATEGQALSIAYGYDVSTDTRIQFTYIDAK